MGAQQPKKVKKVLRTTIILLLGHARAAVWGSLKSEKMLLAVLLLGHARAAPQHRPPRHWYEDNFRRRPGAATSRGRART